MFLSAGEILVKIPEIPGVLVRRGILVKVPGNCEVFVVVRIELCLWSFPGVYIDSGCLLRL